MIGTSVGYGGDTAPLGGAMEGQMVLSSRNVREASKMYIVAVITLFVMLLLVTLPALGAIVQWPWLRNPEVDREKAYGLLMAQYLPPGMLGLLFVVMLAAVMSTIGSNLIFGSQVLVSDVYRRYPNPGRTDRHYLWVGRGAAAAILALAIVVAFRVDLIFHVAAFMVAASAAELPANWAQWWWWRFNQWGRISASFGGIIISALVWLVLPTQVWPWWERTYLVIGANTALWVVVTLLTPADSPAVLERFYRKGRPLGAWGPVRRRCDMQTTAPGRAPGSGLPLILGGLGLAVLGAVAAALLISGLSSAYVGRYESAAVQLGGFLASGAVFLGIYGKYLDRLEEWAGASEETLESSASPTPASAVSEVATERGPAHAVREPVRTSVVVALATAAYGPLLMLVGLLSEGRTMAYNLIAGAAFLVAAAIVWITGRTPDQADARLIEDVSPALAGSQADMVSPAKMPRCSEV